MGDTPPSFPLRVRAALWPVPDQLVRVISPGHRYLGPGLRGANKGWKICTQGRDFKSSSSHQKNPKETSKILLRFLSLPQILLCFKDAATPEAEQALANLGKEQ